jgi:hypothetical protein
MSTDHQWSRQRAPWYTAGVVPTTLPASACRPDELERVIDDSSNPGGRCSSVSPVAHSAVLALAGIASVVAPMPVR